MDLPGSARYGIAAAPDGLDVVQDLLNTSPAGLRAPTPDLLATAGAARAWAEPVAQALGLRPAAVRPRELARLRDLRAALRDHLHARDGRPASPHAFEGSAALRLDADGVVRGDGPTLADALLLQVFAAQARADWPRLKLCALESCDLAFHDRTKNRSARYHDPRCANFVNLHNHRERRRRQA